MPATPEVWRRFDRLTSRLVPIRLIVRQGKRNAARAIGMTEQGLNKKIKMLEEVLEVPGGGIVSQGKGSVSLTPVGQCIQALLDAMATALNEFEIQLPQARAELAESARTFRLGVFTSVWDAERSWLKPVLESFAPEVCIMVEPIMHSVSPAFREKNVDAAVGYDPVPVEGAIRRWHWRDEPMVLVMANSHLQLVKERLVLRAGGPQSKRISPTAGRCIETLAKKHPFYTMPKDTGLGALVRGYSTKHYPKLQYEERVTISDAIGQIAKGHGFSILPMSSVGVHAIPGIETVELESSNPLYRRLEVFYRNSKSRKAIIDHVIKAFMDHDANLNPNPYAVKRKRRRG